MNRVKRSPQLEIYPGLFLIIALITFFLPALGTIAHEYGHILVARGLGCQTTLHYASMNWHGDHKVDYSFGMPVVYHDDSELYILLGGTAQRSALH